MVVLADRILDLLGPGVALDDDELAERLGVVRQQVNQTCNRLARQGVLIREPGWRGKIVNRSSSTPASPLRPATSRAPGDFISEDEVKQAIKSHLEAQGYAVEVAWGRERGIDIDARRGSSRLIIEAKAEVASQPQQTNYFLGALGELVQRMADEEAEFGLALPDNSVYRGLIARLPGLARERLRLRVFLVARSGGSVTVREE